MAEWCRASLRDDLSPEGCFNGRSSNPKVCGTPDNFFVTDEQHLGRFVANAKPLGHRVRQGPMCLNGHDRIPCVASVPTQVFDELVERFRAHAARITVLEEDDRPALGRAEQRVEISTWCNGRSSACI
jgi:hypothetical protein